ncbi:MAG: CDGSH iron-sulfur domain-containing protein [Actinomycetota bacterium]|nr:CDGSH iron-sulfur domain-containing protein [Actinomycetota bacterium]
MEASGGHMDEIIRAVRDCPSGALSYAIDEHEARQQVDHGHRRAPSIEVAGDGPYRISGALCRCGHPQNKPFCSGMHWSVGFHDPVPDARAARGCHPGSAPGRFDALRRAVAARARRGLRPLGGL